MKKEYKEMCEEAVKIFDTVPAEQERTLKRRSKPIVEKYMQNDILEVWKEAKRKWINETFQEKRDNNRYWYKVECILIYSLEKNPWDNMEVRDEFLFN